MAAITRGLSAQTLAPMGRSYGNHARWLDTGTTSPVMYEA